MTTLVTITGPRLDRIEETVREDVRRRLYSNIFFARSHSHNAVLIDVEHAGERRRIEVSDTGTMAPLFAGIHKAHDTLCYLDDLRQGMRDLVDQ